VAGFFFDYGNPYFQFYLPRDEVIQHWPNYYSRGLALWLKSGQAGAQQAFENAEQKLRAAGARPGDWISQREVRQLSVNIFDRTFAITSAMNLLTLIVAGIALMASLLAILQERLPQFAQWRALGVNQREQWLLISCPLVIFVTLTWLLAMPLGALLSWLLINKLNIVSFGWSMPTLWSLQPALELYGLVMGIVLFTIAVVMLQLRRQLPTALAQLGEQV
jgi:putative ABC transport system permease protein